MITVAILINGNPLMARSASHVTEGDDGHDEYHVDTGETIWLRPDEGAIALAKKLLDTIKERP